MRGRAIRCPFCGSVQEVPPGAPSASPPPQSTARRQPAGPRPREVLAVEPVPDRIVIDTADLDTVDVSPPPPR